jgi:predicted amidohydrolase
MAIGVGLIERASDDRLYNTYVVCMPDGQRHIHRKLHAFEHPAIDQGDSFTASIRRGSWRSDLLGQ